MVSADRTRRGGRHRRILAGAVLLVLVAFLVVSVRLYVFPVKDAVSPVDAVIVIGPVEPWRLELAGDLIDEGVSDVIAIARPPVRADASYCDPQRYNADLWCFAPEPATTQGEAIWVRGMARQEGWNDVLVITRDWHIERTRFVFESCLGDEATVAVTGAADDPRLVEVAWQFLYQTGGFAKAVFVTPGC